MAEFERGGLSYPIKIVDGFSDSLLKFRDELQRSRESWDTFRSSLKDLGGDTAGLKALARDVRGASRANESHERTSKKAADAYDIQKLGAAALKREMLALVVAEEKEVQAAEKGISTRKKIAADLKQQAAATKALADAEKARTALFNQGLRDAARGEKAYQKILRDTARLREAAREAEVRRGAADAGRIINNFDNQVDDQRRARQASIDRGLRDAERAERDYRKMVSETSAHVRRQAEEDAKVRGRVGKDLAKADAQFREATVVNRDQIGRNPSIPQPQASAQRIKDLQDLVAHQKQYFDGTKKSAAATKGLGAALKDTDVFGNKLLFTFRRLVGVFAVFQAARVVTGGFSELLKTGIQFNNTLEQSRFGIAGIIASVAKVTDAQGRQLEGAEKYVAAQTEARRQQELLRQDALNTVATYQELLDVFQIATGPGLNAGLKDLDQVRQIAVLVSQAASAIGQDQRQLSEEIRALLTGNIRQGQSRIANVIGITPEQVRTAKEQGNLFDVLQRKLQGFALAANDSATTVKGLFTRLKDVIELITGTAAAGLFEDLRQTLKGFFETLTVREKTEFGDILKPNPEVQKAFEAIYEALRSVLQAIRDAGAAIGTSGLIGFAEILATTIEVAGRAIVAVVRGAITGFALIRAALTPVIAVIDHIAASIKAIFGPKSIDTIVSGVFAILTVIIAINGAFAAMSAVVGGKLTAAIVLFGKNLLKIGKSFLSWPVAIAAAVQGLTSLASELLGVQATFLDLPAILGTAFASAAAKTVALVSHLGTTVSIFFVKQFKTLLSKAKQFAGDVVAFFDLSFGSSEDHAGLKAREREIEQRQAANQLAKELADLEAQKTASEERFASAIEKANQDAGDRLNIIREEIELRQQASDLAAAAPSARASGGPFGVTGQGTEPTEDEKRALRASALRVATLTEEAQITSRVTELRLQGATEAQIELDQAQQGLSVLDRRFAEKKNELLVQREIAIQSANAEQNEERKALFTKQVGQTAKELLAEEELATAEKEKQLELIRRLEQLQNGSIGEGFAQGFRNFGEQFASSFQAGIEIATGLLNGFVDLVSSSIVDAFDPTKEFDIKERFARFLQDIAKLIIQQLTQIAIAKAILGLGFGAPGLASGGPVGGAGFAAGGRIPRRTGRPSLAHTMRPQGLARGGRPAGLHHTDTVPIWAAPGEWMMRVAAVRKYGVAQMSAINDGLIDPSALRSLAASAGGTARAPKARVKSGFATGGEIARTASSQQGQSGGAQVVPAVVANEGTMEALISGGARPLIDFMRKHANAIQSGGSKRI